MDNPVRQSADHPSRESLRAGFTIVELLIVVSIIALLFGILVPSLSAARQQARGVKCLGQLRVLGQALVMYSVEHGDVFVPSRMPKVDDCNWYADIAGGQKYRPTFIAMMSKRIGVPPFEDPKACKSEIDASGEPGDRQDYSDPIYVCPSVAQWTDERNGSYGYNYHFLGNSRLRDSADIYSFKNWPVRANSIRVPAATVAVGDCMGTAASYPQHGRGAYVNNSRDGFRLGNEGFNLDPPRVDPVNGEMACFDEGHRTSADPRHRGRTNVLWLDGHATRLTLEELGYVFNPDGSVGFEGNNRYWSGTRQDRAWTQPRQAD